MGMRAGVVMPKRRSEVVADRERRMCRVVDGEVGQRSLQGWRGRWLIRL